MIQFHSTLVKYFQWPSYYIDHDQISNDLVQVLCNKLNFAGIQFLTRFKRV